MEGFLDKLAGEILQMSEPHSLTVLFPNRRPAYFLEQKLMQRAEKPLIAPQMVAITDFLSEVTGYRVASQYDLLLLLYQAYAEVMSAKGLEVQAFDRFSGWGPVLLNDFDEIDKFLVEPRDLLTYVSEIKELEQWSPSGPEEGKEMNAYLTFFQLLPEIYQVFHRLLEEEGAAYAGKIYRKAWETIDRWSRNFDKGGFIIAGFNALTLAEEKIFTYLVREKGARTYWDADECYFNEPFEAGKFLRKYKDTPLAGKPYKWRFDACRPPKEFYAVHAPDDLSQVQFAVNQLKEWEKEAGTDENAADFRVKTVVVLNDPSLLYPFLYALPPELKEINLTFALPVRTMQIYRLLDAYLRFFIQAVRNGSVNLNDFVYLAEHPFFPGGDKITHQWKEKWKNYSAAYMNNDFFFDRLPEDAREFFSQDMTGPLAILKKMEELLEKAQEKIPPNSPEILGAVELQKLLERLQSIQQNFQIFHDLHSLQKFFRRLAAELHVHFQGVPLKGYQIMGLLETRLLDFERVIMLGMNEGIIPKGKKQNSFIPFDVRKQAGMPVYSDKNAVTAYHFYRLISRARAVWLVYNAATGGLTSGEPSRYILQLKEILPAYGLKMQDIYLQDTLHTLPPLEELPKDEGFTETLKNKFATKGVSPSLITNYWYYPESFFLSYVLGWEPQNQWEDVIALNRLGNVIHATMKELYDEYLNRALTEKDMDKILSKAPAVTENVFYREYLGFENIPGNYILKGRNLLALEAAKEMVKKFLHIDRNLIKNGKRLIIHEMERYLSFIKEVPGIGPVKFKGIIDRIDSVNGQKRIVDYKTGNTDKLKISANSNGIYDFEKKFSTSKAKYLFQLYFYMWLVKETATIEGQGTDDIIPIIYSARQREAKEHPPIAGMEDFFMQFERFVFDALRDMLDPGRPFSLSENLPKNE